MNPRALLARVAAMDREELRFRAVSAARHAAGRLRFGAARPAWRRGDLVRVLDPEAGPAVRDARDAARRGDFLEAHVLLARHFETRPRRWPLAASSRHTLAATIRDRFPTAAIDARDRAERIVEGRFDLLGYHDLPLGTPPDWHWDAVHGRRAPRGFWTSIPYLDPATGDHKVIWEINRHQHFSLLGAAHWLTGHRRFRDAFILHLDDWLRENPPLDGINWTSMLELAFRSLAWTWAIELFAPDAADDEVPWLVDLIVALDRQLEHVEGNLSTYFSPNTHISGEALALYAVSLALPELRASGTRAAHGRDILLREAEKQILADGGHAERSSHYHRYSTDFYLLALLVARLTDDAAAPALERAVRAQAGYLRTIADDRGRLPGIGDEDGGQLFRFGASSPSDASPTLSALAAALDEPALAVAAPGPEVYWILGEPPQAAIAARGPAVWPSRALAASGYFVSRSAGGHLVFDAGAHGFLNGGHAHADALSVVLTVDGVPLLVDPGTATYTMDAGVRDRFRSAAQHNTITVGGHEFARPRGPFLWERTTDARLLVARTGPDGDFAAGVHEGYGFPHVRAVLMIPGKGWFIVDALAPTEHATPLKIDARWHLHPSWTATASDGGFALAHASGATLALATTAAERSVELAGTYSSEYGRIERASVLQTGMAANGPAIMAAYVPLRAARRRCPKLVLAGRQDTRDGDWTEWTLSCEGEHTDVHVTVALPRDLRTTPRPDSWPQPCIQELRASCVE